jgi:hypothetical protein
MRPKSREFREITWELCLFGTPTAGPGGPAVKLVGSRSAEDVFEDVQRIERRIVRLLPPDPPQQFLVGGFRPDIPDRPGIDFD